MKEKQSVAEKLKIKKEVEAVKKNLNLNNNEKIIINKQSKIEKILKFFTRLIKTLIKIIFFILIGVLVTIGITVLINENTREIFLNNIHIFK
ncbi:unknown [Clostridium sp. CAG:354]|nr:unknown [Clostridium sp. CAG:354]HIT24002.1 hypothetical protein [Candidatus Faecimonas intestinavium]